MGCHIKQMFLYISASLVHAHAEQTLYGICVDQAPFLQRRAAVQLHAVRKLKLLAGSRACKV